MVWSCSQSKPALKLFFRQVCCWFMTPVALQVVKTAHETSYLHSGRRLPSDPFWNCNLYQRETHFTGSRNTLTRHVVWPSSVVPAHLCVCASLRDCQTTHIFLMCWLCKSFEKPESSSQGDKSFLNCCCCSSRTTRRVKQDFPKNVVLLYCRWSQPMDYSSKCMLLVYLEFL